MEIFVASWHNECRFFIPVYGKVRLIKNLGVEWSSFFVTGTPNDYRRISSQTEYDIHHRSEAVFGYTRNMRIPEWHNLILSPFKNNTD